MKYTWYEKLLRLYTTAHTVLNLLAPQSHHFGFRDGSLFKHLNRSEWGSDTFETYFQDHWDSAHICTDSKYLEQHLHKYILYTHTYIHYRYTNTRDVDSGFGCHYTIEYSQYLALLSEQVSDHLLVRQQEATVGLFSTSDWLLRVDAAQFWRDEEDLF